MFFSPPITTRSSLFSFPYHFIFSFFLKKQTQIKRNIYTHTTKTEKRKPKFINKRPQILLKKKSNVREKVYRNSIEYVLCWPITLGHGTYPTFIPNETLSEKVNYFFFANKYQLQIAS